MRLTVWYTIFASLQIALTSARSCMGLELSSAEATLPSADLTDPCGANVVPSTVYSFGAPVAPLITKNYAPVEVESADSMHRKTDL